MKIKNWPTTDFWVSMKFKKKKGRGKWNPHEVTVCFFRGKRAPDHYETKTNSNTVPIKGTHKPYASPIQVLLKSQMNPIKRYK